MTPKRDHEEDMSMEEILASIRRFVTDNPPEESETKKVYTGDLKESIVIPPAGRSSIERTKEQVHVLTEEQQPYSPRSFSTEEILDLKNPLHPVESKPGPLREQKDPPSLPKGFYKREQEEILTLTNPLGGTKNEGTSRTATQSSSPELEEGLSSSQTLASSAHSLSRLAQTSRGLPSKRISNLADQRNLTLDQLIQDMIRPLIKEWIDTHLPSLVEEMVAKEIKRITKHLG